MTPLHQVFFSANFFSSAVFLLSVWVHFPTLMFYKAFLLKNATHAPPTYIGRLYPPAVFRDLCPRLSARRRRQGSQLHEEEVQGLDTGGHVRHGEFFSTKKPCLNFEFRSFLHTREREMGKTQMIIKMEIAFLTSPEFCTCHAWA